MPGLPINDFSASLFTIESALLWLVLLVTAVSLDLVAGQYFARYLPSIDTLFQRFVNAITKKLDRPSRTLTALRLRGIFIAAILIPAAYYAGIFANYLMTTQLYTPLIALLILIPVFGQKMSLTNVVEAGRRPEKNDPIRDPDPHAPLRQAGAVAILGFALKLLPRTLWFCLGGFALLLPQMLLATFVESAEKRKSGNVESPFFSFMALLYEFSTAPPAFIGALLLALAHFFLPGTNLWVLKAFDPRPVFFSGATFGPASRYFPLNVAAVGLSLSLEADIGEKTAGRKISDKTIHWIGPADGRAQLMPANLRQIWLLTLIALAFYFLIAAMVFLLLLQLGGSG